MTVAKQVGAKPLFMDLPAWSKSFLGVRNRYADRYDRYQTRIDALCHRLGCDGSDALWDHLFEQPEDPASRWERLQLYFAELRGDARRTDENERDGNREEHMARCIAWALAQGGDVVVVCGGWHAPELERAHREVEATWPDAPEVDADARLGSYLVPYSFRAARQASSATSRACLRRAGTRKSGLTVRTRRRPACWRSRSAPCAARNRWSHPPTSSP